MSRFFVGQRVRIKWSRCFPQYEGVETTITGGLDVSVHGVTGQYYECYSVAIDESFGPRPEQLEPILPEGHQPSDFKTLADLLASLEVTA